MAFLWTFIAALLLEVLKWPGACYAVSFASNLKTDQMIMPLKLLLSICLIAAGLVSLAPGGSFSTAYAGQQDEAVSKKPLSQITMFKSPTCGCCAKWAQHLRDNGFSVKEIGARSMAEVKRGAGISSKLRSCHTAFLKVEDGAGEKTYVIEGHVPAKEVKRLLTEKPDIKGLTVPGMPIGSPGMEAPDGRTEKYDVLSFDDEGDTAVFESY
ncbi:MAG: hypothetical protein DHS20C08_16730 [Rhodomicrobium sp.]|nr:MAG: hypothetical protein DHS20C08_16730 [Rhodomicrobium sp.]